jgi:hypothetical protein
MGTKGLSGDVLSHLTVDALRQRQTIGLCASGTWRQGHVWRSCTGTKVGSEHALFPLMVRESRPRPMTERRAFGTLRPARACWSFMDTKLALRDVHFRRMA